jgi:hypothetical protein
MRVFVICGAHSLSIPPRHFSRHFVLRLHSNDCENSINSSNDGVDDSHITNPNMADIKQNDQTEKTDLSIAN